MNCHHTNIVNEDGYNLCIDCGVVIQQVSVINDFYINRAIYNLKSNIYKRYRYFLKKIDLINATAPYDPQKINDITKKIEEKYEFDDIHELKAIILKFRTKNGIRKHIYRIYYQIKGKKAVIITRNEINKLKQLFIYFEKHFCLKYMNNYNMIIYNFLKIINNQYYENIILPVKSSKNIDDYNDKINEIYLKD